MKYFIIVILGVALATPLTGQAVYEVGDTIADFTLTDLEEATVSLYDLQGKIILLNFFTTWCPGCNEEAHGLENNIWQVYQDDGVVIVSVDIMEPLPLVQGWAAANDVTYDIWLAPDWSLYQQFEEFGAIPYNTVLDQEMTLRYKAIGYDQNALIEMIETILDEVSTPVQSSTWGNVKALFH